MEGILVICVLSFCFILSALFLTSRIKSIKFNREIQPSTLLLETNLWSIKLFIKWTYKNVRFFCCFLQHKRALLHSLVLPITFCFSILFSSIRMAYNLRIVILQEKWSFQFLIFDSFRHNGTFGGGAQSC